MIEIKSLSFIENKKYANAINHGYFDDYDNDPRAWKHTFVGAFIWRNPRRVAAMERFREVLGHIPTWEDITDINLEDFADEIKRRYAANTAHTTFAEVKAIIHRYEYEVTIPSKRYTQILSVRTEPSQNVYLTEEEIERIHYWHPITRVEKWVKRIFLIEAYTGARNCDSLRLSIENCDSRTDTLTYVSQKTKTKISVPVHENLMPYLRARIDEQPPVASSFNETLRRICQECGINEQVTVYRFGKQTTAEKWRLVSSHTGRRSFATNLYLRGVHPSTIAHFMGHSSPDITLKRYILAHVEADENAMKFFKGKRIQQSSKIILYG